MTIGYLGAFLGGALSLLSPCSALLLPAFFAYAFADRVRLLARTGLFYCGLATTLVPMGLAAGSVGAVLNDHRGLVVTVSGIVVIALGLAQILGVGFGSGTAQRLSGKIRISSGISVYLLGTVYGLAGFCAGPLLGSVLTMAMAGSSAGYGGLLLAIYALGMTVPLFVIAALWDTFDLGRRSWLRGRELRLGPLRVHSTTLISGLLFLAIGVLFLLTDGTGTLGGLFGMDAQYAAQTWVQQVSGLVSDVAVVIPVALVVLAVTAWLLFRRRPTRGAETQPGTGNQSGTGAPSGTGAQRGTGDPSGTGAQRGEE